MLLAVAAGVLALDALTKLLAVRELSDREPISLLGGAAHAAARPQPGSRVRDGPGADRRAHPGGARSSSWSSCGWRGGCAAAGGPSRSGWCWAAPWATCRTGSSARRGRAADTSWTSSSCRGGRCSTWPTPRSSCAGVLMVLLAARECLTTAAPRAHRRDRTAGRNDSRNPADRRASAKNRGEPGAGSASSSMWGPCCGGSGMFGTLGRPCDGHLDRDAVRPAASPAAGRGRRRSSRAVDRHQGGGRMTSRSTRARCCARQRTDAPSDRSPSPSRAVAPTPAGCAGSAAGCILLDPSGGLRRRRVALAIVFGPARPRSRSPGSGPTSGSSSYLVLGPALATGLGRCSCCAHPHLRRHGCSASAATSTAGSSAASVWFWGLVAIACYMTQSSSPGSASRSRSSSARCCCSRAAGPPASCCTAPVAGPAGGRTACSSWAAREEVEALVAEFEREPYAGLNVVGACMPPGDAPWRRLGAGRRQSSPASRRRSPAPASTRSP